MAWMLRVLTVLMGVYFLSAAALQYNDPDPVQWMAIYLAAALALARRLWRWYAVGVAVVAAVWAATLAPGVIGHVALRDLFGERGMLTPRVEEAREMLGLLIVVMWMGVLAWTAPSRSPNDGRERRLA
jgi:transmembrane protein TMEM220